ncbi:lysine biosynthesis enzyme LysX [Actinoplanes sp. NBRC 14428]|uniref:[lysine-biosynthesis-protein LysW]--L-2-aminoadipate ligase n=1 Tax=Pseudosporangium ferrugineum TaxID=439699 RepID=A0A2T0RLG5_9ACTN|nr:RimK family alpha-L-glutamate ligase [Pseudosporangium ferrugineum]PRY22039.1 [lysine-biosynthesis-protein LysW]--L-2-aminoadipate ligase [Pseudosporangium ferrugineum]BCJ50685.1 lysine biosynthesis enzyme LysX [Actinoplanes sp. NBRC 14428]
MTADLAVLTSRLGADDKRILIALERRGLPVHQVDPRRLAFAATGAAPWSLVLNREISASRARHAAHTLEAAGATVLNCAAATDVCADKWLTTLALRRDGVPTPRTTLALTPDAALDELDRFGYPAVIKPLTGSWGRQVGLLREPDAARAVLEHRAALPNPEAHLIYLQEYVEKPGRDIRVVVIGGRPVAAAYRVSRDWRCNVALGAETRPCPIGPELAKAATAAARAVDADLAGVDLVEREDGELLVLEVNHNVELAGAQRAAGDSVDLAGTIAALVADRYESGAR